MPYRRIAIGSRVGSAFHGLNAENLELCSWRTSSYTGSRDGRDILGSYQKGLREFQVPART
jgi:hypothetical protein